MKKVIFLAVIMLTVGSLFMSCTNNMDEEINQIENHQSDDYGEDDVAKEETEG